MKSGAAPFVMLTLLLTIALGLRPNPFSRGYQARATAPRMSMPPGQRWAEYKASVAEKRRVSEETRPVAFVNPLEVDGFAEPGGWGSHADPSELPLFVFFPGMDGP